MYNSKRMDTIKIDNIRFYNFRKLAEAKRRAGSEDVKDFLPEYERLAGKYDILEDKKPVKKVVKKTAKKAAKKTSKRATKKTA